MQLSRESIKAFIGRKDQSLIRIAMLGPSGVGKTSLLATMYDRLEATVMGADLQLSPQLDDAETLDRKIADLKRLFATDTLQPDPLAGIAGDAGYRAFEFGLGRRAQTPQVRLEFVDYQGGWIEGSDGDGRSWVVDLLRVSEVVLIPIDAPALMEWNSQWHAERNRPDFIYNLMQEAYRELSSPKLVVLCPIRCELYLLRPRFQDAMLERVKEGYERLLKHLEHGFLVNNVAVVVAPVQTLGEIVFAGSSKSEYRPMFKKRHAQATYCPVDSEQPLRYVLRFAMRLHHANRSQGFLGKWREIFGTDQDLIKSAEEFAYGCKTDAPFAILQGQEWLRLRKRS